jgi:hypothetical protein
MWTEVLCRRNGASHAALAFHSGGFDDLQRRVGTIIWVEILAVTKDGRMNDTKASADVDAEKAIDERIASLLEDIRKEAIPQRLLELARKLQKALDERNR